MVYGFLLITKMTFSVPWPSYFIILDLVSIIYFPFDESTWTQILITNSINVHSSLFIAEIYTNIVLSHVFSRMKRFKKNLNPKTILSHLLTINEVFIICICILFSCQMLCFTYLMCPYNTRYMAHLLVLTSKKRRMQ